MSSKMTPVSQTSPSLEHESTFEDDESLPPHTSEIGTLKKLPNRGTAWLGSSSGVYFANTVRRAFATAFSSNPLDGGNIPATEDILTGEDDHGRVYNGPTTDGPLLTDGLLQLHSQALGTLPESSLASELVMNFFKLWHPLFPFLHGPTFLKDMEALYEAHGPACTNTTVGPASTSQDTRKVITFQLILNISALDRKDIQLPLESRVRSTADVARVASSLIVGHDTATIQALLAAELYLVATHAIRQASTVAGIVLKLIYHAGLHRCPLRYAQLSLEDCEIRKRIFWSAYALDRHCSLSLGDPITLQDSDIDVCLSGRELHQAVAENLLDNPAQAIHLHMPGARSGLAHGEAFDDPRVTKDSPEAKGKELREAALTAYVNYGKLTGRIIEIFHKSIHARFAGQDEIVVLTADIENWWNELPGFLTGLDTITDSAPHQQMLAPFFTLLYQRLNLLLHRPRLSLEQNTPEFQHGLQVCIRSSRNIIAQLNKHRENRQSMFLPGLLSATWMAGLIAAFACQLGKYPKSRACSDIQSCLSLLESMNMRWFTISGCRKVLSQLLTNIQCRKASSTGYLAPIRPDALSPDSIKTDPFSTRKRPRMHGDEVSGPSPKRENSFGVADSKRESISESKAKSHSNTRHTSVSHTSPEIKTHRESSSSAAWEADPVRQPGNDVSPNYKRPPSYSAPSFDPAPSAALFALNPVNGSTIYANAADMAFAQSNMALPELPSANADDPMFWGNLDYNLADVFNSVTWEQMTGSGGPNMGGMFGWDPSAG